MKASYRAKQALRSFGVAVATVLGVILFIAALPVIMAFITVFLIILFLALACISIITGLALRSSPKPVVKKKTKSTDDAILNED